MNMKKQWFYGCYGNNKMPLNMIWSSSIYNIYVMQLTDQHNYVVKLFCVNKQLILSNLHFRHSIVNIALFLQTIIVPNKFTAELSSTQWCFVPE